MHPSRRNQEFHMDRSQRSILPPPPPDTSIGIVNGFASNQLEEVLKSRYSVENGYPNQNNFVAPWHPNGNSLHETSGKNDVYASSLGEVSTELPPLHQLKAYESSEIAPNSRSVGVQEFPRYGQVNSNFNASGDLPEPSSKQPLLVENSQSRSTDPRMYSVGVEGQLRSQENSNVQEKSGAYGGLNSGNPSFGGRKLAEFHNEHVNDIFARCQQIGSGCGGVFSSRNAVNGDTEIEKTLSSAASGLIQALKEGASAKKVEIDLSIYGHDLKNEEQTSSLKVDDNVASKASEKLWNGTLQLSSSVKLSAAGYFISGDKMPDMYWSESVEVKGKVRLDAFEKYIKDLHRSRNRGLMVMSLQLREGSSKDEMQGMNEVIKKYKDGTRVGLARLPLGVDVYICPNSEMIITILAKNGFSKDLVAVQENQDSLIGCVVWRKNTSSDPESRKPGNESLSGQPSSSSPNSNPQQVTGSDSSSAKPRAETIPLAAVGNNLGESKNAESSGNPEVVGSSSSSPSHRASTNFNPSTVDVKAFPPSDLHAIHSIVKQLTDIEASIFQSLGIEKHPGNLQLLRTILPSSSEIVKQPFPATEDDDLPEYDFGAAVTHASTSTPLEANATKIFRPINELVTSSQMCVEPLPQRREVEITSLPVLHEQAMKTTTQATGNVNPILGSKRKNLFDEDDMPEWNPPDMEHFKPLTDQTTRPSFAPNTFKPNYMTSQVALPPPPPLPPQPPQGPPPFRPQHRPYNSTGTDNHNRWSHR